MPVKIRPIQDNKPLSPQTIEWVQNAVGRAATLISARSLPGATSSTLHALEVRYQARDLKLVLRQFTLQEWLVVEPDLAAHEAAALAKAGGATISTPELIAWDETGESCGLPAVLMTRLPGSVELKPADRRTWLAQLAETALAIHTVEAGSFPWDYYSYTDVSCLEVPDWSRHRRLWQRAYEILSGPAPDTRRCFIHRDYHPTNVLWLDGQVSGVVDWVNACRGTPGLDLAHCRYNLVGLLGLEAADRFLTAYQSLAGSAFDYCPYWDLRAIADCLSGPPGVYSGWVDFGVTFLTDQIVQERVDAYLVSLMNRF